MKFAFAIILSVFSVLSAEANHSVSGFILDEVNEPLPGTSVVVLNGLDSTMVKFGMTDSKGEFRIMGLKQGDYILQSSFVGYTTSLVDFSIVDSNINLGNVQLLPSSESLNEVSVNAQVPISLRGDTLVYLADAFKTAEGASVEDLLRKLPGIEVKNDGEIKAQGETVEKVLVNGKEFFGDDPTIATKNLESKTVQEVQVFDKTSEEAEFTGIDDGEETKTINLELKEEYKSGYFGKLELQAGTEETWKGKLNYNKFNDAIQFSAIAAANNTGESTFGINDIISMAGGIQNLMSGGSSLETSLLSATGNTKGIPVTASTGINLNGDISSRTEVQNHLMFNRVTNTVNENLLSNNFSPGVDFTSETASMDKNTDIVGRFKNKWKFKLSESAQLLLNNQIGMTEGSRVNNSETQFTENDIWTSSTVLNNDVISNGFDVSSNAKFLKKMNKEGRNWVSSFNFKIAENERDNAVDNDLIYELVTQSVRQNLGSLQDEREFGGGSAFTEPLGKDKYLTLSTSYSKKVLSPGQSSYDIFDDTEVLNSAFSGSMKSENTKIDVGLALKVNMEKHKFNVGVVPSLNLLVNSSELFSSDIRKEMSTVLPYLQYNWKISRIKDLKIGYSTEVLTPRISELFSVINNSNPNMIFAGNENLDLGYSHNFSLDFNSFKTFNGKTFFVNLGHAISQNQVVNALSIDENFVQTVTPENASKYNSSNVFMEYGINISKLGIRPSISVNSRLTDYIGRVNQEENEVLESMSSVTGELSNMDQTKFGIDVGYGLNYNTSNYSLRSEFNQNFFNHDAYLNLSINFSKKLRFKTDVTQNFYSNESFSASRTFTILNSSLSLSLRESKWRLSLFAKDLLNQNIGFSRSSTINSLVESRYNALGRYVGLKLSFSFKKR